MQVFAILQLNVPLPDCAPGEWGPTKAVKLLGLVPLSHLYPVINAAPDENVVLKVFISLNSPQSGLSGRIVELY